MARPIVPHSVAPRDMPLDPDGPVPVGWKRSRSGRLKRRNILWRIRRYLVAGVALLVLAASGVGAQLWASVKVPDQREIDRTSLLCDASVLAGCDRTTAFAEFGVAESDEAVRWSEIPKVMVHALIAAEDKDFYNHKGVDPTGIARAVLVDVQGTGRQGGSTLTQQLVKVMSEDDSPTLGRKVREAVQAMKLEQETPKDEILTRYFNSIYYGRNARGLAAAVRAYFGRDAQVEQIDLKQAAYLAALIREPEHVDANRKPDDPEREEERRYATIRRANVLDAMLAQGYITRAQRDEAANADWDYVVVRGEGDRGAILRHGDIGAAQWRDYVRNWIIKYTKFTEEELRSSDLRVYSSMNPILQMQAYNAVRDTLKNTPEPWLGDPKAKPPEVPSGPEASLSSIDSQGMIRAMVGSRNPASSLNIAAGRLGGVGPGRQPGSAFKPVVLAEALLEGRNLDDKFDNPKTKRIGNEAQPEIVTSVEGDATPHPINLIDAMTISSNTVFGQLQYEIKNAGVIDVAKRLGLGDHNFQEAAKRSAFLGIGGPVHVTTLDMASVYSTFANNGQKVGPFPVTRITDSSGTVLWEPDRTPKEAVPADIAQQINSTLTEVIQNPKGTGNKNVKVPNQIIAGKTGTVALEDANKKVVGNSDAWFVGYTCKLTAAVWMGHRDGATDLGTVEGVNPVNGGTLPARIFTKFMTDATAGGQYHESCPFVRPASSITTTTAPPTTAPPERDRPWWERDRDRDEDRGDRTTTTSDWWPPRRPTTTDRDDRTTTTRRPTTTTEPDDGPGRPRPGLP